MCICALVGCNKNRPQECYAVSIGNYVLTFCRIVLPYILLLLASLRVTTRVTD